MRMANKLVIMGISLVVLLSEVLIVLTRYTFFERLSQAHPQIPVILGLQIILFIIVTLIVVTKRNQGLLVLTLSIISTALVGYLAYVLLKS